MGQNCPNVRVKISTQLIQFYNLELAHECHDDVARRRDLFAKLVWQVLLRLTISYMSRLILIEFAPVEAAPKSSQIEQCHSVERVASFMSSFFEI